MNEFKPFMTYTSNANIIAKPNLVNFTISIAKRDNDSRTALKSTNDLVKYFIDKFKDQVVYVDDSMIVDNIEITREVSRYNVYKHTTTDLIISEAQYQQLKINDSVAASSYVRQTKEDLLGYIGRTTISFDYTVYNSNPKFDTEKVKCEAEVNGYKTTADVAAFIDVIQECVSNMNKDTNINCKYNLNVNEPVTRNINNHLYAKCINDGLANLREIANLVDDSISPNVELLEIADSEARNYASLDMMERKCAAAPAPVEEEPILNPEMVENLFNYNIRFNKTVILKVKL